MTDNPADTSATPETPFHDLDAYVALPRLGSLAISPDGRRLATGVSTLNDDATGYVTALWEVDPTGERPARRLTRGAKGESQARFTPAGDLLFVAKRPGGDDDDVAALWTIPADGAEARILAAHPGGIEAARAAESGEVLLVQASALPSATDLATEKELRTARKEGKVAAILHTGYPVRYWDHDLGPAAPRLYAAALAPGGTVPTVDTAAAYDEPLELRDLTPDAGTSLINAAYDLAADGSFLVTTWRVPEGHGRLRSDLVRIDVATGERTPLLTGDTDVEFAAPRLSPDGTRLAFIREDRGSAESAVVVSLWLLDLGSGEQRRLAQERDSWPGQVHWLPDGSGLLMTSDEDGRAPVFHIEASSGAITRLTDDGAFSDLVVAPDGTATYALRASYAHPAEVVRVDLPAAAAGGSVTALRGPVPRPELPGRLTEVETTADDGTRVRSWLALPHGAGGEAPAPLLLWIHGGPLSSWNSWSWRWNPWLMVAQGYAVLLPDPALSTGYGQHMIQRGWGRWGAEPYTDLMAATDAAEALPEIDETRTAAMGGSFGGYMANWVAGHTDRFRAIVTHASLWALDGFGPTTDAAYAWERQFMALEKGHSPHEHVGNIRTPMLVVHGDKDYRVPIGEGLRLWYELLAKSALPQAEDGSTVHRFLYFPDENHWVLKPQHAKVWYQVVLGFLGEHVRGEEPARLPELLG